MIKLENHLGVIDISDKYFVNLVGSHVINCFGVAAMASAPKKFFGKRQVGIDKGIGIRVKNNKLIIDLHIIVTYGTNISEIVKSIMHKVQYVVEDKTGFNVAKVNV
ncbi:MAG: Asp23/Gls24 family envelope stress response protein, partial [Oscillospiraceae bacterium]